jgi:hypothetical protein
MRWFRDNIRQGSWLAVLALAINLALSFGHFHAPDGKVVSGGLIGALASVTSPDDGKKSKHPNDGHGDLLCPICIASSSIAHALTAAPPALPVEFASAMPAPTPTAVLWLIEPPPAAFQSRGPPLS